MISANGDVNGGSRHDLVPFRSHHDFRGVAISERASRGSKMKTHLLGEGSCNVKERKRNTDASGPSRVS